MLIKVETVFGTQTYTGQENIKSGSFFKSVFETKESARKEASKFVKTIKEALEKKDGIESVRISIEEIEWEAEEITEGNNYVPLPHTQYRVYTTIQKEGRKTTANDIYGIINYYKTSYFS